MARTHRPRPDNSAPEELSRESPLPQTRGQRQWKIWLRLGLVFIFAGTIVALLAFGFTRDPRALGPSPILGKEAPPFSLRLFDGPSLDLADLKGKIVFLNFWASWCPPCRDEARMLEAGWRRYKDRSVIFLGVNIFDREQDARDFIAEFGITYPNGWDLKNKVAADYGVWGLPETFIMNREGLIIHKHVGAIGWEKLVAKLGEA
ncbi:MAG: redoxin domain-containing protein, partial [Deltaproteobacteria bacterium]|nr:redoxin domain-containing protein [Deltaproteobacteria bacterium]